MSYPTPVRRVRSILILVMVALNCSCAGGHLYRSDRHETAQAALKTFEEANLGKTVENERARLKEMLYRELEVVKRHTLARRDLRLRVILRARSDGGKYKPWEYLENQFSTRMKEIAGDSFDGALTALLTMESAAEEMRFNRKVDDDAYKDAKRKFEKARTNLSNLSAGELGEVNSTAQDVINARDRIERQIKVSTDAHKQLLDEKKKLAATSDLEELAKAADEIKKSLESLTKAAKGSKKVLDLVGATDLELAGNLAKSEALTQILDELVAATQPEGNEKDTSEGETKLYVAIVRSLTGFARTVGDSLDLPRLNALQLELEHQRLVAETFRRRIGRAKNTITLLERKRSALLTELAFLCEGWNRLRDLQTYIQRFNKGESDTSKHLKKPDLVSDFATQFNSHPAAKELTAAALIAYVNAWTVGRTQVEEIDYLMIAAQHMSALDDSEVAILQWENLIATPLKQVIAYYGAGIKSDSIVRLLEVAGLAAVAAGVN